MRVVNVINSMGIGGAERQLASLALTAASHGSPMTIIALRNATACVGAGAGPISPGQTEDGSGPGACGRVFREMQTREGAVFVAWMYHSWLLVLLLGSLFRMRGGILLYCRHANFSSLKFSTKLVARISFYLARLNRAKIVFNSSEALNQHRQLISGIEYAVLPNGFSFNSSKRAGGRRRVIGFFGRNHKDKGADLLKTLIPEILSASEGWSFRVAGPGMESRADEISDQAIRAGIDISRIRVEGAISDVVNFYQSIDVLILPSRAESFPNVAVEAAAAGVLVAAMDVGDVREIFGGRIDCAHDLDGLVRLVVELCKLEEEAMLALSAEIREHVCSNYSWDVVYPMHRRLWLSVL